MKNTWILSTLVVALMSAGLNADTHDTDVMDQQEDDIPADDLIEIEETPADDLRFSDPDGQLPITREQLFLELDIDGNGVITREEAREARDTRQFPELWDKFDELDTADSNFITQDEFEEIEFETIEVR